MNALEMLLTLCIVAFSDLLEKLKQLKVRDGSIKEVGQVLINWVHSAFLHFLHYFKIRLEL